MLSYDKEGIYPDVVCPECGSDKKTQLATACNFMFANPVGTDRYNNSHDYRYRYKQPQVAQERAMAEKLSHMGGTADIYKEKNDLEGNSNWDFAKI